jgi:hypothetical protein
LFFVSVLTTASVSDKDTTAEFILGTVKAAWIQRRKDRKPAPIVVLDDIHNIFMAQRSTPETIMAAGSFSTWMLEQQKEGLAVVKELTSIKDVVAIQKKRRLLFLGVALWGGVFVVLILITAP